MRNTRGLQCCNGKSRKHTGDANGERKSERTPARANGNCHRAGRERWVIHHIRAKTISAKSINNSVRSGKRRGPPERVGGVVSNGRIRPMTVGA